MSDTAQRLLYYGNICIIMNRGLEQSVLAFVTSVGNDCNILMVINWLFACYRLTQWKGALYREVGSMYFSGFDGVH